MTLGLVSSSTSVRFFDSVAHPHQQHLFPVMFESIKLAGRSRMPWKHFGSEDTKKAIRSLHRTCSNFIFLNNLSLILCTNSRAFMQDQQIPNLLAFHPSVRFTEDPLYISGNIILQDKASCFPAHVLSPPAREDAVVIDATSAPGNKTSHLCAIMQNKGKVSLSVLSSMHFARVEPCRRSALRL